MKTFILLSMILVLWGCSDSDDDDIFFRLDDDGNVILPDPILPPSGEDPDIVSVLPVNIASGIKNRVSIYGENLDELPGLSITIGGQRVTDVEVVGDKEIMIVTPELEAGNHEVRISSLLGFENAEYSLVSHGEAYFPSERFNLDVNPVGSEYIQNRVICDFARNRIYYKTQSGIGVLSVVDDQWANHTIDFPSNDMILGIDNADLLITDELDSRTDLIRMNLDTLNRQKTIRTGAGQRIMQFYDGEILIPSRDDARNLGLGGNSKWRYTRTRNRLIGGATEEYLYVHTQGSSSFYTEFQADDEWEFRWNMSESSQHFRTSRHDRIRGEGVTDDLDFNDENMTEISPNAEIVFRMELRQRLARVLDIRNETYGQQIGEDIDLSSITFSRILELKITDDNKYAIIYGAGPTGLTDHFIQAIRLPDYD